METNPLLYEADHRGVGSHALRSNPWNPEQQTSLSGATSGGACTPGERKERGRRACKGVSVSVCTEHFWSTTSPERLLSHYLRAYTGVDQIPGLNQGKVFPHVPIQRLAGRKPLGAREEGRGGSEEAAEEGRKTEELPM